MYLAQGRILQQVVSGKEIVGWHKGLQMSGIAERLFGSLSVKTVLRGVR